MNACLLRTTLAACLAAMALFVSPTLPARAFAGPETQLAGLIDVEKLGREEHPKIVRQFGGEYPDPKVRDYVTEIGNRLVRYTPMAGQKFTFTVLNSDIVNAFAVPGRYVYVTRGLLALANSEAELAGVLGHEIGHINAHHGEARINREILAQLGLGLLGGLVQSDTLNNLVQFGALAWLRSYSREQEFEADRLGVTYMNRAGYDAEAMARFLNSMKMESDLQSTLTGGNGASQFSLLSTHPRTEDRVKRAISLASSEAPPVSNPRVGLSAYMHMVKGLYFDGDPENGFVKGDGFYHPKLRFAFDVPPKFTIINNSDAVLALGPGNAQIVFDFARRPTGTGMVPYVRDVWGKKLELSGVEALKVNGMAAATGASQVNTNQGQMDVRLVAVHFREDTVARFLFVTPPDMTGRLRTEFERTTYSYRRLSPEEAGRMQPYRVDVARVQPGQTAETFAARMPFPDFRMKRFRILNGLGPDEKLQPGWYVKYIGE